MTDAWVEKDPVVIRNVNRATRWQKGLPNQGKTNGRWHTIDGHWRNAQLMGRMLDDHDGSLQARLDAGGKGLVHCKKWLPTDDGREDWKYFTTDNTELIAECAIDPAKREQAQLALEKGEQ